MWNVNKKADKVLYDDSYLKNELLMQEYEKNKSKTLKWQNPEKKPK